MASATQHTFSGHETFPFRYPWLNKGFDAVEQDGDVFLRDDAITTLGVGKNMVRSIRHWCLTAGIVEPNQSDGGSLKPTKLGRLLFADKGLDPYLEDPATLWLLHWQIASNRWRASTWFWTFSHFHEPEFTRDGLAAAILKWTETLGGKKVAPSSIRRDVEVFLRTYLPARHAAGDFPEDSRLPAGRAGTDRARALEPDFRLAARPARRTAQRHPALCDACLLGSHRK